MKFTVITLGCKVNAYDSESYVRKLKDQGYTYVSNKDISDIYIINSCAVTNAAATKTRQRINQASRLNPEAMIVLVGCYAQVETNNLMENSKIDLIVGSNKKSQLADLILETLAGKKVV